MLEVYWGVLLGSTPEERKEGSRIWQREKLSSNVVFVASAGTKGSSEVGTIAQNCPQLGNWGQGFILS